eukprot:Tbor_TRINITY_DN3612_c0_g1::TRINITY_DN3612_c0_g1_i1::g.286::m.286
MSFGGAGQGGGAQEVGDVTGTMAVRHFDDQNRPFIREDLSNYVLSGNMTTEELDVLYRMMYKCGSLLPTAFALGFWASKRHIKWKYVERTIGIPKFEYIGRFVFGFAFMAVPLTYIQQSTIEDLTGLPQSSTLGFQIRRMLISQRGAIMFGRSSLREVTKEEQRRHEAVSIEVNRNNSQLMSGESVNVNAELQKQVLLPVAQTGYTKPPV